MNIIAVNGSPNPAGSTARLVEEVLAGAAEVGAQGRMFQLGQMRVSPCIDCGGCRKTARCVVDDDMTDVFDALKTAASPKGLVLGTPIYLDHITAQLKAWIDRMHCFNHTELGAKMFPDGFRAVLVVTYGEKDPHFYDDVSGWLGGLVADRFKANVLEQIILPAASVDGLPSQTDLLARARQAGRDLAKA